MSEAMNAAPEDGDGSADDPETRLRRYLSRRAADGEFYFKGKFIAEDVGLTPSQIGTIMARLRGSETPFDVERWSYSNATTWRVRPADAGADGSGS